MSKIDSTAMAKAMHKGLADMVQGTKTAPFTVSGYTERQNGAYYAHLLATDGKLLEPPTQTYSVFSSDDPVTCIELGGAKIGTAYESNTAAKKSTGICSGRHENGT